MKKLILLILATLVLVSCTNEEDAKRVLEAQGFNNIEITGYNFFGCGKDDVYHTGFVLLVKTDKPSKELFVLGCYSKVAQYDFDFLTKCYFDIFR